MMSDSSSPRMPRRLGEYPLALLLSTIVFLAISATDIFLPSLPQITSYYQASPEHANWLLSTFIYGLAIGSLFCGFLSDRFGRRTLYLWGMVAFTLSTALIPFMPTLDIIITLRLIQGLSASMFVVVSRQIIHDICSERKQLRFTGMLSIGVMLSPAVAPVIGAYLAHLYSWRACFLASALLSLVLLLTLVKYLPETLPQVLPLPKANKLLEQYTQLLRCRLFIMHVLAIGFAFTAYFTFICTSSYIFIEQLRVDQRWFAKIFIVLALAYLLGNMLMQHLNKRGYPKQTIISRGIGTLLFGAALGLLALLWQNSGWIAGVLTVSALFMRGGYALMVSPVQVTAMHALPQSAGGRPGTALGVLMCVLYILSASFSHLISMLDQHMLAATVIGVFVFSLLSLGFYLLAQPIRQARLQHP